MRVRSAHLRSPSASTDLLVSQVDWVTDICQQTSRSHDARTLDRFLAELSIIKLQTIINLCKTSRATRSPVQRPISPRNRDKTIKTHQKHPPYPISSRSPSFSTCFTCFHAFTASFNRIQPPERVSGHSRPFYDTYHPFSRGFHSFSPHTFIFTRFYRLSLVLNLSYLYTPPSIRTQPLSLVSKPYQLSPNPPFPIFEPWAHFWALERNSSPIRPIFAIWTPFTHLYLLPFVFNPHYTFSTLWTRFIVFFR
jgi:hypothetical protein